MDVTRDAPSRSSVAGGTMIEVAVVVVTYESAATLDRCLRSVPSLATVTVVDNASSDDSAEIAERHGAHVIRNSGNRGFAAAVNAGVEATSEPLVLLLNPDAWLAPGALESMVATIDADPECGAVGPRLAHPDGRALRTVWPVPSSRGSWLEALGLHRVLRHRRHPTFLVGTALLLRRTAWQQVGGFDERFWLYGEDADLSLRLTQAGWRLAVDERAVVVHVGGASGEATPARTFEHFQRGAELLIEKHEGRRALTSHRASVVVAAALRAPFAFAGGRNRLRAHPRWAAARRVLGSDPGLRTPTTGHDVVVCSLEAWDEVWRRNQSLVRELLREPDARVLFVEPPHDLVHGALRRQLPTGIGLRPVDGIDRLWVLRPLKPLPRLLGPAADSALTMQLERAVAQLGMRDATWWLNDVTYASHAVRSGAPVLYDITDDWLTSERPRRELARLRAADALLLERADTVVVCSEELARRRAPRAVHLIPNAVDVANLRAPRPRPDDLPAVPVALYAGTLHEDRLDVGLVGELAAGIEGAVVLVGPDALRHASRRTLLEAGVILLGARPHSDLPAYLQSADVLVVPHVVTPFTESLDPLKLYECLAVGRPTVATPVAGFRDAGPPVRTALRDAFVAAVREAMGGPGVVVHGVPTWAERAAAFRDALVEAREAREARCR